MRLALALSLVLGACSGAPPVASGPTQAAPSPTPAALGTPVPATTPSFIATPAPSPTDTPARVGASIDFRQLPLVPATFENAGIGRQGSVVLDAGTARDPAPLGGTWISIWREPGFAFTRLVPSWNATTPEGTWITTEVQARRASGGETRWYSFGTWAFGDDNVIRASLEGQRDTDARVETDTLLASIPLTAYRVRVTLARRAGVTVSPSLMRVAAVASDDAAVRSAPASVHGGVVRDLSVPLYSQEIHRGEYPQYDGGGEAWCSPTSTAMVLGFWRRGPSAADLGWVDPSYRDPVVDHAARFTYDATYRGTGNWSFNTAYAAQYDVRAFVTQLRSLAEAERFIASGIPLVASVQVPAGGLPGFLYAQGAPGHLLVIRGFTAGGDVIVNDPAALSNGEVRKVYPRAAFERAWVGGSGGIVYVIHPIDGALPAHPEGATPNW